MQPLILELQNLQEALKGNDKSLLRDALQFAHDQRAKLLNKS